MLAACLCAISFPALADDDLQAPKDGDTGRPADDDARARDLFKKGQAAYEDGDYRTAWEHFHKAYMLSKRPELLYNVGQTADRLRNDREALKAFRMYLQRLPDAENAREVRNRVRVLEERVAEEEQAAERKASEEPDFAPMDPDDKPFQDRPEDLEDPSAPPPPPDGAQPLRTGWYFRGAAGLGAFRASLSAAMAGAEGTTLTSTAFSGELAVGHALMPGIVLGGAIFFDLGLAPKEGDLDIDRANLTLFGAFADWYLNPDEDGWHLEAAVALASLSERGAGSSAGADAATGGALLAGGGFEWGMDADWGLGVLGRLTLARLSSDVVDLTLLGISVQATATWF